MPKSMQKNVTFQKVGGKNKNGPRCDFEPKRSEWATRPPRERPPVHARVQRKGSGRKKEEASKKEMVRGNKGERWI